MVVNCFVCLKLTELQLQVSSRTTTCGIEKERSTCQDEAVDEKSCPLFSRPSRPVLCPCEMMNCALSALYGTGRRTEVAVVGLFLLHERGTPLVRNANDDR